MTTQLWQVSVSWRLRQVMADNGMYATSDIIPHLAEHGITMSTSQAHRLVTGSPERLNLTVLAALCHILGVTADELIVPAAPLIDRAPRAVADTGQPRRAGQTPAIRPIRVQLTPEPPTDQS